MADRMDPRVRSILQEGIAIPASPLALSGARTLDERRQRALCRYYAAAGAGGIAVGVHTTQFRIRDPKIGLFRPVLELAAEEMNGADASSTKPLVRIGGVCGGTGQAVSEASLLHELGYHAGLVSLAAMKDAGPDEMIAHCGAVAEVIPLVGFYLQRAVGGPDLPYAFWRRFAEIEGVVAVKIAPFDRYRTIDVVRAVVDSGRDDIALYTGNDDNIVADLLTPFRFHVDGEIRERRDVRTTPRSRPRRIVGGLLGHWSVWTLRAIELLEACHAAVRPVGPSPRRSGYGRAGGPTAATERRGEGTNVPAELLARGIEVTDANAAFFDAANGFAGCIAGIHEVLRRQGLLEGIWCLDPAETLSPGQAGEIDRVYAAYPHLNDDAFVAERLEEWLRP